MIDNNNSPEDKAWRLVNGHTRGSILWSSLDYNENVSLIWSRFGYRKLAQKHEVIAEHPMRTAYWLQSLNSYIYIFEKKTIPIKSKMSIVMQHPKIEDNHSGINNMESSFSRRKSSCMCLSNVNEGSHLEGFSTTSSSSSRPHLTVPIASPGEPGSMKECHVHHLARIFIYPENVWEGVINRVPLATKTLCDRYVEPVSSSFNLFPAAVPTRSSFLHDRHSQTPLTSRLLKRRSSSLMTFNSEDPRPSRPLSRRSRHEDNIHSVLEEESEVESRNSKSGDPCKIINELSPSVAAYPQPLTHENECGMDDNAFRDLVKGLHAIPYITVSRSSSQSDRVVDVRTMTEIVGRANPARRNNQPSTKTSCPDSERSRTKSNTPGPTPAGISRDPIIFTIAKKSSTEI